MVSRSMPPELSAPSESSTTAPSGSVDDSASTCCRLSPKRVAGSDGRKLARLLDALRLPCRSGKDALETSAPRRRAVCRRARRRPARCGSAIPPEWPCCANRPPGPRPRSAAAATWRCEMAGCHSRNSSSAIMAVSSSQITKGRAPVSDPLLRRTCQSSKAAAASPPRPEVHSGQEPSSTNWPF